MQNNNFEHEAVEHQTQGSTAEYSEYERQQQQQRRIMIAGGLSVFFAAIAGVLFLLWRRRQPTRLERAEAAAHLRGNLAVLKLEDAVPELRKVEDEFAAWDKFHYARSRELRQVLDSHLKLREQIARRGYFCCVRCYYAHRLCQTWILMRRRFCYRSRRGLLRL